MHSCSRRQLLQILKPTILEKAYSWSENPVAAVASSIAKLRGRLRVGVKIPRLLLQGGAAANAGPDAVDERNVEEVMDYKTYCWAIAKTYCWAIAISR